MASNSAKKSKKSKEKKISLQDFLAVSGTASAGGTTQVAVQKVSSWAEECEDDEEHKKIEFIQLPTAPRSARILEDDSISQNGPFYARVSNLPFDTNEDEVAEFFMDNNIHIQEMKLARDDSNDRLRGFGLLEFETREDLIDALTLADLSVRGRRIRLEPTNDPDGISGRTVRKRYDNYTPRDSANESTNWRERKESNFETVETGRDRDGRDNNRRNYQSRSNFQNRHDNNNNNNNSNSGEDSNWRVRDSQYQPDSPPSERKRFGDRGGDRGGNRRFGDRGGRDSREPREMTQEERPKLNIAPRTLPLPELNFPKEEELERGTRKISLNGDHDDSGLPDEDDKESAPPKVEAPKPKPVPKENIFGMAKPVDTAAREKEIEEKMEHERHDRVRQDKERREKEREDDESAPNVSERKEVIVIRTENSRRQDETNWRKRDDPPANQNGSSLDNKNRGAPRQIGRSDDRPRPFKEGRDNRSNFNNRDRDYRGNGGIRRDNNNQRGGSRDYGPPRRDYNNSEGSKIQPREQREIREPRRDMPKFIENTGTKLQVSNAFAGLDDEVDAD